MKLVVQTFNIQNNEWFKNIYAQLKTLNISVIIIINKEPEEKLYYNQDDSFLYIHTTDNVFEYTSFYMIHKYIENEYVKDDIYMFIHDSCILGSNFELKVNTIYSLLKDEEFDYAPIAINRKSAKMYPRKYKTKFNICCTSFSFMKNDRHSIFHQAFSCKTGVCIELGNHEYSFRMWENVKVCEKVLCQVQQSKKWKPYYGKLRMKNYIENIDLYKYVSKAFLKAMRKKYN